MTVVADFGNVGSVANLRIEVDVSDDLLKGKEYGKESRIFILI